MARENNTISVGWFLVGAAVGASIALLYAPQSGKDTRRLIAKKGEQSKDAILDSGKEGSMGRYAPPALRIPKTATTMSSERFTHNPTRTSGPTPRVRRWCANWFALLFSCS